MAMVVDWIDSTGKNNKCNIRVCLPACFIAMHTRMNKIVGILLFIVLLFAGNTPWQFNLVLVCITCAVATFAAIQEGHFIRMGKEIL